MKLLTVHRLRAQQTIEMAEQQQRTLLHHVSSVFTRCDSCVYAHTTDMPQEVSGAFEGTLYVLATEVQAPSEIAKALFTLVRENGYDAVLFVAEEGAAEVAALLAQMGCFSFAANVETIHKQDESIYIQRPVYSNNVMAHYALKGPFVLTYKLPEKHEYKEKKERVSGIWLPVCKRPKYVLNETVVSYGQQRLPSDVLIAAGMGVSKREDIERIRTYAKEHGFDFGVTRPVAMRGWAGIEEIIGVSGSTLAPKLTVAIGISGAAAFYVGIEKSSYILAVNPNKNASIVRQSDAVLVENHETVLDSLFAKLSQYGRFAP